MRTRSMPTAFGCLAMFVIATIADPPGIGAPSTVHRTNQDEMVTRGITGRIVVESEHGHVRGRPDQDLDS